MVSLSRVALAQPGRLWRHYLAHLEARPVRTKAFTSFCAAVLGDALAQQLSRKEKPGGGAAKYDWARTARMAVFNGAFMGPLGHHYYRLLDGSVMPHSPKAPAAIITKILIDQLGFAPLCTCIFFAYQTAAQSRFRELAEELTDKLAPTMIANWCLWPAAHVINFAFVPPRQRVLYANVVSVAGTYLLSRAAAGDFSEPREVLFDGVNVKMD